MWAKPKSAKRTSASISTVEVFNLYSRATGVAGLALIASTFDLWMPQEFFPQVPLLRSLPFVGSPSDWPASIDYLAVALITIGMVGMMLPITKLQKDSSWQRYVGLLPIFYSLGFGIAVLIDQHRMQPWAVQFLPLSLLFSRNGPVTIETSPNSFRDEMICRLKLARLLVLGIYFWSAFGKLDYQFAHTVGHGMLAELLSWIGIETTQRQHNLIAGLALTLPIFEAVGTCFLCIAKTRRLGVYFITLMHLILFLVLGPLGLNHRTGVLLWNLFSMVQVWLLFGIAAEKREKRAQQHSYPIFAGVLILAMLCLPVVERFGIYDHWLSWALYAPHSSRVSLTVPIASVDKLPETLQRLIAKNAGDELEPANIPYVQVPLDEWSLQQLHAPIYPQDRFQLGVAWAVIEQAEISRDARLEVRGMANRINGSREVVSLNSMYQIKLLAGQYWLNAQPAMAKFKP